MVEVAPFHETQDRAGVWACVGGFIGTFQQFLKPLIRLDAIVASKKHVQGLRKLGLCLRNCLRISL